MDDDGYSSGVSGWAWHELGRQAEQAHQGRMQVVSEFAARLRGEAPVNVGAVMAENHALWQQNQAFWQQNQALLQRIQELETSVRIWDEDYQILKGRVVVIRDALRALEDGQNG